MAQKTQIVPYGKVGSHLHLGALVRRKRLELGMKQVEVAGLAGVGIRFLSELERGKATLELGRVLQVLARLGLEVWLLPRGESPKDGVGP